MTQPALGHGPKYPGTAGRPQGPSETSPSCLGIAGPPLRPLDQGQSHQGHLVDPKAPRTRTRVALESWSTPGGLDQARVARSRSSTPQHHGHGPESPRKAGRHHGPSGMGPSHPGLLVHPASPRNRTRVARDCWSTPKALGPEPELPGTFGRPCGPSDLGRSRPEHLVDPVGPWTRARGARDRWSTPWALGYGPESPRAAGRHRGTSGMGARLPGQLVDHGPSDPNPSRPGELVDTAGPKAQACVAQDSWSTPSAFRPEPHSPGTAG